MQVVEFPWKSPCRSSSISSPTLLGSLASWWSQEGIEEIRNLRPWRESLACAELGIPWLWASFTPMWYSWHRSKLDFSFEQWIRHPISFVSSNSWPLDTRTSHILPAGFYETFVTTTSLSVCQRRSHWFWHGVILFAPYPLPSTPLRLGVTPIPHSFERLTHCTESYSTTPSVFHSLDDWTVPESKSSISTTQIPSAMEATSCLSFLSCTLSRSPSYWYPSPRTCSVMIHSLGYSLPLGSW